MDVLCGQGYRGSFHPSNYSLGYPIAGMGRQKGDDARGEEYIRANPCRTELLGETYCVIFTDARSVTVGWTIKIGVLPTSEACSPGRNTFGIGR